MTKVTGKPRQSSSGAASFACLYRARGSARHIVDAVLFQVIPLHLRLRSLTRGIPGGLYLLVACCAPGNCQVPHNCHAPRAFEFAAREHPTVGNWSALGGWYGERGQYGCAIPAFQAALRIDPHSATGHYYLGLALEVTGKRESAVEELQRSIELDPNQLQPRLVLGLTLNTLGRQAQAEEAWERALQIDPNSIVALDWLAKARISNRQLDAAVDLLRSAPRDETLTLDLALAYSQSHQLDQAIDLLRAAIVNQPNNPRFNAALATIYIESHRYQDANDLLGNAVKSAPTNRSLQLLHLRVLVFQDDDAAAQPLARKFLLAHPHDFDALYLSGVVDDEMRHYSLAVDHLRAAVALNPNHYDSRFNLGDALFHLGQNAAAREQLEKAITLDPAQAQGHFRLSQVLGALGHADAAQEQLKLFQQCQENTVRRALAETKAAQAAEALNNGNSDGAAALYREAIKAQPGNASLHLALALALEHAGTPEHRKEERAQLEEALALKPDFALAKNQLGLMAALDGDDAGAEHHFRDALATAPLYADAANNLGTLLAGENREREAESYFRLAISANPRAVSAWVNLAATLAIESRFAEAHSAAESALKVDPSDADALRLLQTLGSTAGNSVPSSKPKTVHGVAGVQKSSEQFR